MNDGELSNDAEESNTTGELVALWWRESKVVEGGVEELALTEAPETDRKVVIVVTLSVEKRSGGRT